MNRITGAAITGIDHLRQSVADILTTAIGTRVMRREYGSLVPELVDHPDNPDTQVRLFAAIASALMRWEPRLRLTQLHYTRIEPGKAVITLDGLYLVPSTKQPQVLSLSVPLSIVSGAAA
jgi:phage baseplate assembly protein W